ncbi:MAG: MATE family efflux transporter, partial [Pygmaiobacter massiliensis]|nr:MATE family efflux transporter [Pygmaiobacter massiliensis]
MQNKLGQDFTLPRLLRFTAPSALMLMFMALYQMVDGIFVSNFVGENALSALNIAYPVPSVLIAVSVMLSTGGSALVARTMGEKKPQQAKQDFSLIVVTGVIIGILFAVAGLCFLPSLVRALGATDLLYED